MKVLIISTNADASGAPLHVQTLVQGLQGQVLWHAVFGEEGPVAQSLRDMGIAVSVVPTMRSEISPVKDWRSIVALSRLIRTVQPDILHLHSSKAGMLGRIAGFIHGVPVAFTVHGWGWRGMSRVNAFLIRLAERMLRFVPRSFFIYVAKAVESEAWQVVGIPRAQGRVIYIGVADHHLPDTATTEPRPLRIIMPARVTVAKDHETLVRAFETLDAGCELLLCGEGTNEPAFLQQLARWAPTRHVHVRGLGSRRDMPELLASCDVFALISNFDALPLSVIEAMSAGLAVVGTDVGGIGELIEDGRSGLLVRRGNVDDVAAALVRLRDADLRRSLGGAARRRYLDTFTSGAMCRETLGVYEQLGRLVA